MYSYVYNDQVTYEIQIHKIQHIINNENEIFLLLNKLKFLLIKRNLGGYSVI